jgi:hypothetical protein
MGFKPEIEMMRQLIVIIAAALLSWGCSNDDTGTGMVVDGDSLATYTVTFAATWSATSHPVDFPSNAHFSGLIGATHKDNVVFWRENALASPGIQNMAETGGKNPLGLEVDSAIVAGSARFKLSGSGISISPGQVGLEFTISEDRPLVTLVSMIAPSPDWFVGVADLPLRDASGWIDSVEVDLYGWDAGTDDGTTYTSPNAASMPHVPIFPLEEGMFKVGDMVPALGTFTFVRHPQ